MNDRMSTLVERIKNLEAALHDELEADLIGARKRLLYRVDRNRIWFERDVLNHHRRLKLGLARFFATTHPLNILSAPVVYSLLVPFVLLDLWVSLYQAICFPIYGIERVRRRDYLVVDRHHLRYLNAIEKLNCFFCSYANGLIAYVREIAARTEQYWCPIKHAQGIREHHRRYHRFVGYGDPHAYRQELEPLRAKLATLSEPSHSSHRQKSRRAS